MRFSFVLISLGTPIFIAKFECVAAWMRVRAADRKQPETYPARGRFSSELPAPSLGRLRAWTQTDDGLLVGREEFPSQLVNRRAADAVHQRQHLVEGPVRF